MKILLLSCLILNLQLVLGDEIKNSDEIFGRRSSEFFDRNDSSEADESMRHIEEEVSRLNKTGDVRDKRALGILLQGIMEALGYTVSPIQIAAIPNPSTSASMMSSSPGISMPPMGMMMSSTMPMNTSASPPRQRETLRFTGVLNFGNNLNTTNLVNHLAQYEQLFHGNRTSGTPSSSSAAPPSTSSLESESASNEDLDIDPRVPLSEPLLVKIPLPIVPNLPPPQHGAMPAAEEEGTYQEEEYGHKNSEEYHGTEDGEGKRGNFEEERDNYSHSEEYENNREQFYRPEDRNYNGKKINNNNNVNKHEHITPIKSYEKEYKKKENVINYSIENKEIRHPSEVSEEVPRTGSKFGHSIYIGEPNWKQKHDDHVYRLAAEQEARAEALAEENAEREKDKSRDYEMDEDNANFHHSREKEINDRYEIQKSKHDMNEKSLFFDDDEDAEEQDAPVDTKIFKNNNRGVSDEEEDFEEDASVEKDSEIKEETNKVYKQQKKPDTYDIKSSSNKTNEISPKHYKALGSGQTLNQTGPQDRQMADLPISYNREIQRQDSVIRDSYGESLEKPVGGRIDDRVAGYFSMFKNPRTGVYDPNRIQQFDYSDLIQGFERIQKEYGSPKSKYEEYEIDNDDDDADQPEHRLVHDPRVTSEHATRNDNRFDYKKNGSGNQDKKSSCDDCSTQKSTSNGSSTKNKLPSKLTPPKKSEEPSGYGPYYSDLNNHYQPLEFDHGIISRLTTYNSPTTKFKSRLDQSQSPSQQKRIEKGPHSHARPLPTGIPEKLTLSRSLVQEVETKEFRAWPAPFDYVFDNSEQKDVIMKNIASSVKEEATQNRPQILSQPLKQINFDEPNYKNMHSLPPKEAKAAERIRLLLKKHEDKAYDAEKENYQFLPKNYQSGEKLPQNPRLIRYFPNGRKTEANDLEEKKKSIDAERYIINDHKKKQITIPTIDKVSGLNNEKKLETADSNQTQFINENKELSKQPRSKLSTKFFNKKNNNIVQRRTNIKKEKNNSLEKDGSNFATESMPYIYNQNKFKNIVEPENTGKTINFNEYRNIVESIKLSELKQVNPG